MKPSGAHTHPEMGGGGNGWIIILILILVAAVAEPVAHAADDVIHVAVEVLKITLIVFAVAVGMAIAGLLAVSAVRIRRFLAVRARSRTSVLPQGSPSRPAVQGTVRELTRPPPDLERDGLTSDEVPGVVIWLRRRP